MSTDDRIAKWTRWIEGQIKNEVLTMHLHRHAWQEIRNVVHENGTLPDSYWWEYFFDIYGTSQAVAVRREADEHRDAASLGRLIAEISGDPSRITREFWLGLWQPADPRMVEHLAVSAWAEQYGGGDSLDPAIPAADLAELRAKSEPVTDFVDRHLAHSDAKPIPAERIPELADVHDAIDVIGRLFRKYSNLLRAASWVDLVPTIQGPWLDVFRVPWIKPDDESRDPPTPLA